VVMAEGDAETSVLCVSVYEGTGCNELLAPYAFTVGAEQTYSQVLEGLFLASSKYHMRTRFRNPIFIKCYVSKSNKEVDRVEVNLSVKVLPKSNMSKIYFLQ
jgi:hypothetical protein